MTLIDALATDQSLLNARLGRRRQSVGCSIRCPCSPPYLLGDCMNRKGFTLIELLIVVVIIGILAAIAIPKFANTKSKAYLTAMKSDLRNLVTAEEAFFSDSTYYTSATTLVTKNSYKNSSGVGVPAVVTGAGYWNATVPHSQLSGATCGIGVNTANPTITTAGDGEPSCYVP